MNPHIEQTITKYYPKQVLVSPLSDASVTWSYDAKYEALKAVLAELKALDPELQTGTRTQFDIAEELIVNGDVHVYLSYLGPYAAINYHLDRDLDEAQQEAARGIERLLARHKLTVLSDDELEESVQWFNPGPSGRRPQVWDCLFVDETQQVDGKAQEPAIAPVVQWQ